MQDISNIIKKLNEKIKSCYSDFSGVYIYGSFARGENTEESDIDAAAVFDSQLPLNERMKLWEIISELEAEYNIIFDLHPFSKDEFKRNSVYYNQAANKGIFYGA